MTQTENFNLNKPEPNDPLRLEDFNENSDRIDAALGAKGNCSVETGTYTGDGTYDSGNKNSLTFSDKPMALFVSGGGYTAVMLRDCTSGASLDHGGYVRGLSITWNSSGTVLWYSSSNSSCQLNFKGTKYTYVALLA